MAGTVISSAAMNDDLSDIAAALTGSLPRNGEIGMSGQFKAADGNAPTPGITFSNDLNTGFFRPANDQIGVAVNGIQVALFTSTGIGGVLPISIIVDLANAIVPPLWYLCYGQAVSRTTYALLFAAIGIDYGSGDGSTTFNLPDLRGMTTYGKDNMGGVAAGRLTSTYFGNNPSALGAGGGSQTSQLITANLPAYTPSGSINVADPTHSHNVAGGTVGGTSNQAVNAGAFSNAVIGPASITIGAAFTGLNFLNVTFAGAAQGGSQSLFANVSPGRIMNKIIYAGA